MTSVSLPPIWPVNVSGKRPDRPSDPLPVITIGGFLGAGKTTLVNMLLSQANGRRFVVFVNDFGDINIDASLIETVSSDRVSLKNGCVCCTLNDELVSEVARYARGARRPDAILIEASGVADPRFLTGSLRTLEDAGLARLEVGITILDTARFDQLDYETRETLIDQAAASDLVLLNKTDIASPGQIEGIRQLLDESAPYSERLETTACRLDIGLILGPFPRRDHALPLAGEAGTPDHDHRYRQWSAETEALIELEAFREFTRRLPESCLRSKGILRFADHPETEFVFNLVGRRATLTARETHALSHRSRLVVIGYRDRICPALLSAEFAATWKT